MLAARARCPARACVPPPPRAAMAFMHNVSLALRDFLLSEGFDTPESIGNLEFEELSEVIGDDPADGLASPTHIDQLNRLWSACRSKQLRGERALGERGLAKAATATAAPPTSSPVRPSDLLGLAAPKSKACLLYTSPSPRDQRGSRMPSSA